MKTKTTLRRRAAALGLALIMCAACAAPASAAEDASAAAMRLTKTTGTVDVTNSRGRELSLRDDMRLYSGYHVETQETSYAWISLDNTKLTKLDAVSELEVRKAGKELELLLNSGQLYFNVTEPLNNDESLSIRTSTMVTGIRGTSGWVRVVDQWHTRVYVLQGRVECSVTDPVTGQTKTTVLTGGDTAECVVYEQEKPGDKCDIIRKGFTEEDAGGFIQVELAPDKPHRDRIEADSGLVFPDSLEKAEDRLKQDEADAHEKLQPIEDSYSHQDHVISKDPVWEENSNNDDSGDSDSGGSSESEPNRPLIYTSMAPVTDDIVDGWLAEDQCAGVELSGSYTLVVDSGIHVPARKSLTLNSGIPLEIYSGQTLQVNGTVTVTEYINNNGIITVTSPNSLRAGSDLLNQGTLAVTATGHVAVEGTLANRGALAEMVLTDGARVRAKTFDLQTPVAAWEVSAGVDSEGYYTLDCLETALAVSGTVTDWVSLASISGAEVTVSVLDESGVQTGELTARTDANGRYAINGTVLRGQSYQVSVTAESGTADFTYAPQQTEELSADGTAATADFDLHRETTGWDYYFDAASGRLAVYGSGAIDDYSTLNPPPWYDERDSLKTVVVDAGVTNIGSFTFGNCTALESVTILDGVTSIESNAFNGCSNLNSVTLPDSVTSIGEFAFDDCPSLMDITIPDSVTTIGEMAFRGCGLTNVTVPDGVKIIDSVFNGCRSLTRVTLPDSIESMDGTFLGCTSLISITIPAKVTTIESGTFMGCRSLTSVIIPTSVTAIGATAFQNCIALADAYYAGTEDEWNAFSSNGLPSTCTIHFNSTGP